MNTFTVAVHSLGNVGRRAIEAALAAPDCRCLGVIRRKESLGTSKQELHGVPDFPDLASLITAQGRPDAVIICGPSRKVAATAVPILEQGIATVDSFDIHTQMQTQVDTLQAACLKGKAVSITAAGWDPGTDSAFRALFEAMAPVGTTFTNFGRGRSMGHSVAARAIEGVADAVSITIPTGGGRHSRLVYVLPEEGQTLEAITARLKADDYFAHDPLEVRLCKTPLELAMCADQSHGLLMERTGASGMTDNQIFHLDMRINNPALTGQILLSCARAATRMKEPGCYTLIDIPPVKLLPGDRMSHVTRLV